MWLRHIFTTTLNVNKKAGNYKVTKQNLVRLKANYLKRASSGRKGNERHGSGQLTHKTESIIIRGKATRRIKLL